MLETCFDGTYNDESEIRSLMPKVAAGKSWHWWNGSVTGITATKYAARGLPHQKTILRSKPFVVTKYTSIHVNASGGVGGWTKNVAGHTALMHGNTCRHGFMGLALHDVSTGKWLMSKRRSCVGRDDEVLKLDYCQLHDHLGKIVTLYLVDDYPGHWSWIAFKNIVLTGACGTTTGGPQEDQAS